MIEKILLGLVVTLFGSVLIYAFRVRQLYVVIPRLFSVSALTSKGKIIEVRIFNKSRVTEEDVIVALSPDRTYEIVASTDSSSTLDENSIRIPRISPGDDYSVLMLVEGGNFTKDEISTVSSKATKGKLIEGVENVPPNSGTLVLVLAGFIAIVATPILGIGVYDDWKEGVNEREQAHRIESLNFLSEIGWESLDEYALSILSENYSQGEFPLFQKKLVRDGDVVVVTFAIVNKTAASMEVRAVPDRPYHEQDPKSWENSISESVSVAPGDNSELILRVFWPKNAPGELSVQFYLASGSEFFMGILKNVEVDV